MPSVGFASLAQSLDRRPSDVLVFAAFLVNAGITVSDEAVSRLALAKPVQPSDSAAVKAEKRLLARFVTQLSPDVSETPSPRHLRPEPGPGAKASAAVTEVKPIPKPALKNPVKNPVKRVR
jgi:hypothetical protein